MIEKARWRGRQAVSSDGLDEVVWQRLAATVTAASGEDSRTFLKLMRRFDTGLSAQQREQSSACLAFLLRYRVAEILGGIPTAEGLHYLAVQTHPKYAKVVNASPGTLEDTLRAVFKMPPNGPQESGARLFVSGVAAAGALFNDPSADLAVIRPHLAKWHSRST